MDRWCTFFCFGERKIHKKFFATEERKEEEASASAAACCFSLEWVTSRFVDTPATYELLSKSLSSSRLMLMLLFSQLLTLYGASSTKSPLALWSDCGVHTSSEKLFRSRFWFIPGAGHSFFYFYSSFVRLLSGPLRMCTTTDFPFKKWMLSCAALGQNNHNMQRFGK